MTTVLDNLTPERLQALSPQLRRAARYVVEHPAEIATRTQRHIADATRLPAPTFTRLARAVGYESYDQLREVCRRNVVARPSTLAERALALVDAPMAETGETSFLTLHAAASIRNTRTLLGNIDQSELARVGRLLAAARRVVLIGEMSGRAIVDYAAYVANLSLTGWTVLGRGGDSVSAELATLGPEDACIVHSISPYARRSVELAGHVGDCGVPIVALTDNALSPFAPLAEHCFFLGTESPQFFPSYVSSALFLEALIGIVIRQRGTEAQQHIAAVERQNHNLNEYWQDGPAGSTGE